MVIKVVFVLLLLLISIFFFIKYYSAYKRFDISKEKLSEYLASVNEIEAMKHLGFINPFGAKEKWHVASRKMRKYLKERIDLQEKNEISDFLKALDSFEVSFIKYCVTAIICVFICFNLIAGF